MFRIITVVALLATIAIIVYFYRKTIPALKQEFVAETWRARAQSWREQAQDGKQLVFLLTVASFLILALSGFLPIIFGAPVSGVVLLLHALAAPVFAVGLVLIIIWLVHQHRFDKTDWQSTKQLFGAKATAKAKRNMNVLGHKVSFWLILVLSIPLMASIVLSMYTLFGSVGQTALLHLHGYSALLLVIVVAMSYYLLKLGDKQDVQQKS